MGLRGPVGKVKRNGEMVAMRSMGYTYREVGAEFGVSRERAGFIVRRAKGLLGANGRKGPPRKVTAGA